MTHDKEPELSKTTKIFLKTCLILMCLTVGLPILYAIGCGIGELLSFIFSGLHYIFIAPFSRPNEELGIWGNIYCFFPYLAVWFGAICLGPIGVMVGAIVLLIGIVTHVAGAIYYFLMALPVAAYLLVSGLLDTPVLGVIAAAFILAITIPCWGMVANIALH